ncbi:hypothetical protein [Amycolatopsis sp. H20-H5]|uniref:hypothetical protein n=1 Tax=Amycolatopsis sp. H20-H5 TaxID=3046309 RepID=UPI002DBC5E43|nr:hypothetical protein [Amycolatopsis sp. H20-H5]MEC3978148.1 hypothetical protein [Amycolatopsis sp. H20-H5]
MGKLVKKLLVTVVRKRTPRPVVIHPPAARNSALQHQVEDATYVANNAAVAQAHCAAWRVDSYRRAISSNDPLLQVALRDVEVNFMRDLGEIVRPGAEG